MATQTVSTQLVIPRAAAARPVAGCRARPLLTSCALMAADAGSIFLAHWFAVQVWHLIHGSTAATLPGVWQSLGLLMLVYGTLNLYSGFALGPVEELRRTVAGTAFVYLFLTASSFLLPQNLPLSRGLPAMCGISAAILVPLGRALARRLFASRRWWGVPVVILGAGKTARMVIERLQKHPEIGVKPVVCFDDNDGKWGTCAGVGVAGPLSLAHAIAKTLHIRHAIVAIPGLEGGHLLRILERCGSAFPHVILIPNLAGVASLGVSTRDLGGVLGLELKQNLLIPLNRWVKRFIDIAGALALGLAAAPIVACAALCIKLTSPGRAFYRQEREGEGGRSLAMPKLRTMHPEAEALLFRLLSESSEVHAEWTCHLKLKKDPRILRGVGRFLRRTSLDELPQLWSVLKGEMSLVGPRPLPDYHLEKFSPQFRALRRLVKPGLTGLWQVSERSNGDLAVQEGLDTYYIRNWSLWLDLYILARTVGAVLFPRGAY